MSDCVIKRVLGGDWMMVCKPQPNHNETGHKSKKTKPAEVNEADSSYKTVEPTGYHSII